MFFIYYLRRICMKTKFINCCIIFAIFYLTRIVITVPFIMICYHFTNTLIRKNMVINLYRCTGPCLPTNSVLQYIYDWHASLDALQKRIAAFILYLCILCIKDFTYYIPNTKNYGSLNNTSAK